jgi:hypothetical protein
VPVTRAPLRSTILREKNNCSGVLTASLLHEERALLGKKTVSLVDGYLRSSIPPG